MKRLCQKTPEAIVAPSLAFVQVPSKRPLDKAAPANSGLSKDAVYFQKSPPAVNAEEYLRKTARIIFSRADIAESTPLKCVPHYSVHDHYAVTRVLRGESMWHLDSEGANRLVSTFRKKINPAKHLLATTTNQAEPMKMQCHFPSPHHFTPRIIFSRSKSFSHRCLTLRAEEQCSEGQNNSKIIGTT
jgi:hypothetical protein